MFVGRETLKNMIDQGELERIIDTANLDLKGSFVYKDKNKVVIEKTLIYTRKDYPGMIVEKYFRAGPGKDSFQKNPWIAYVYIGDFLVVMYDGGNKNLKKPLPILFYCKSTNSFYWGMLSDTAPPDGKMDFYFIIDKRSARDFVHIHQHQHKTIIK